MGEDRTGGFYWEGYTEGRGRKYCKVEPSVVFVLGGDASHHVAPPCLFGSFSLRGVCEWDSAHLRLVVKAGVVEKTDDPCLPQLRVMAVEGRPGLGWVSEAGL